MLKHGTLFYPQLSYFTQQHDADETAFHLYPTSRFKCMDTEERCIFSEEGILVTAEICMGASGNFMANMSVSPWARGNTELLSDPPPGSTGEYIPWLDQQEMFLKC
jgi:hypothetical protein